MAEPKYTSAPKDIRVAARKDTTFVLVNNLAGIENFVNGEKPLELHAGYSRFTLVIMKQQEDGRWVPASANIPPSAVPLIWEKTKALIERTLFFENTGGGENSPAYTVRLTGKNGMKGLTPAQYLAQHPNGAQDLVNQANWLATAIQDPRNAKFRESNQRQYEAIAEAVSLQSAGKLKAATQSPVYTIYEAPMMTPNKNKVDANGFTRVYGIKITCDMGAEASPYTVDIYEAMAPPIQGQNVGADLKRAVGMKRHAIRLTEAEWVFAISRMKFFLESFESAHYATAEAAAQAIDEYNRKSVSWKNVS